MTINDNEEQLKLLPAGNSDYCFGKAMSMKISSWATRNEACLRILNALLLGQLVSFIMALTTFTSSRTVNLGVKTPLTLTFFVYLGLTLVNVSWFWYAMLAFIDVQGNFLRNKAYQYTSITSVTLLDCFAIAWVIILTWIFLGTRYTLRQFLGAAVCILGLGLVLLSDSGMKGGGGSKPLLGDTIMIVATLFYAISNSGEEYCIKRKDRVELLAMLGLFGVLVSICEIGIFERKNLETVKWSTEIILLFAGFAVGGFMFYTLLSFCLKMSGAAMFNLSLLTSDMWVVVIRIFFYHQKVDWLYYLSFAIVVIGLVIYSKFENDQAPLPTLEDENLNPESQQVSRERPGFQDEPTAS